MRFHIASPWFDFENHKPNIPTNTKRTQERVPSRPKDMVRGAATAVLSN